DFLHDLKDHILACLLGSETPDNKEQVFMQTQRNALLIIKSCLYQHKVLHVNYTTYDLCHTQDSINLCMHPHIMVLSHESDENPHPYWYAHVISIFHIEVQYDGPELSDCLLKCVDMLWVQWFACD
ncbi:hypothetical protein M404DRAFT_127497, partial [Pisolithus tinctorius Marx 270]